MAGKPCDHCDHEEHSPEDAKKALEEIIENHGSVTVCKRCGTVWPGSLPHCASCDRQTLKPFVPLELETMRNLPYSTQANLKEQFRINAPTSVARYSGMTDYFNSHGPQTPPPGEVEPLVSADLPKATLVSNQTSWFEKLKRLVGL
jgi:hypothetical protein